LEASQSAVRAPSGSLLGGARRRPGEDAVKVFLIACTLLSVVTTIGILFALLEETIAFFGDVPVADFFFGTDWSPLFADPSYGVLPLIWGTLLITGIAIAVAIPLGLGAAIYLSEYARPRVRKTIKPILETLAGIPTIVFGYFALTFFTPEILQGAFGKDIKIFNALSAGIVMGFMVLPTIASLAEDAMTAVPQSLREGAFGLGASKLQVSLRVVFPAALSGVVAAIVLGISRAIGETMIAVVAAGLVATTAFAPGEPHATMTAFIAGTAKGDVPTGSIGYETIFAVGTTLFFMTLLMNMIAIRFVRKYRQVYE
jgi:phosphate transport system permease protein